MNVHFPKPNEMKIGQLMMHISRMRANMADRIMEQIGLYRGQAFLLKVLAENDGLTHKEIAQVLHISPAAVTKVIKRMAGLKYVERRSDPKDERISRVFLTDEGRSVIHKIKQAFEEIDAVLLRRYRVSAYLFDAFSRSQRGGTGRTFDWGLIRSVKSLDKPVFLSGGLNARNVQRAIALVRPQWLDVSSSVESSPGKKDYRKIKAFIRAAKEKGKTL